MPGGEGIQPGPNRLALAGLPVIPVQGKRPLPTRPRSGAPHGAMQVTVSGKLRRSSRVPHLTGQMYHTGSRVPQSPMEGLTPASAADLPPLGELLVDDPFWQYPAWEGAGHLRVWATATASAGYLAVVTETGGIISVTESAGRIRSGLARRYGPSLVLLEHHPAPESGEGMETLDLVRIGAEGSPHWSRVWPTRKRTRVTPGWNCGWPLTGTRSSADPRAGALGGRQEPLTAKGAPAQRGSPPGSEAASVPRPGMAEARSRGPLPRPRAAGGPAPVEPVLPPAPPSLPR